MGPLRLSGTLLDPEKKNNLGLIRIKTFGSEQDPVKMKDQLWGGRKHLQRSDLTQG